MTNHEPTAGPQTIPWNTLLQRAIQVRERAYCPYSKFAVGAALITEQGNFYSGCNVENASFGLSICAERSALVQMVSAGELRPLALAVVAEPLAAPCGACRQFIFQFGSAILIQSFAASNPGEFKLWQAAELLPSGFQF